MDYSGKLYLAGSNDTGCDCQSSNYSWRESDAWAGSGRRPGAGDCLDYISCNYSNCKHSNWKTAYGDDRKEHIAQSDLKWKCLPEAASDEVKTLIEKNKKNLKKLLTK